MPQPEFWERFYAAEAPPPWDLGGPSPALIDWIARRPPPGPRLLIPGCGRGHDALHLAQAGWAVTAVDFAPLALTALRASAAARGVALAAVEADVLALPETWSGSFDGAIEHTCLAALHPRDRRRYLDQLRRVLRPGGTVAGLWFDQAEFPNPKGPPYPSTRAEVCALFAEAGFALERAEPAPAFPNFPLAQFAGAFRRL